MRVGSSGILSGGGVGSDRIGGGNVLNDGECAVGSVLVGGSSSKKQLDETMSGMSVQPLVFPCVPDDAAVVVGDCRPLVPMGRLKAESRLPWSFRLF